MSGPIQSEFPLFLLGATVLPSEAVPLHVFEPRYRTMIDECLVRDREFGIVWLSDSVLANVGCACSIAEVLERMDDGSMNILARATRPFRLIEREDQLAYPAATVEFLTDADEAVDQTAAEATRSSFATLVQRATDSAPEPEALAKMTAYEMAAAVDFGSEPKQKLLELRSENARMLALDGLFSAAFRRLDLVDRAQARARSNGKVRF